MVAATSRTTHYPLTPDKIAALNARARRSLLRVVGADTARLDQTPDDGLADYIASLNLELDAAGDLTAALCTDGRMVDHAAQQAFPDILSADAVFTFIEED